MKKKIIILLFLFLPLFISGKPPKRDKNNPIILASKANFLSVKANTYSFESTSPPPEWKSIGPGSITISTRHYKGGKRALLWNWQKGSKLKVTRPLNLEKAGKSRSGGYIMWLYNEKHTDGKLIFNFKDQSGKTKCSFLFDIYYKGWRCVWVRFKADIDFKGKELSSMEVIAPTNNLTGKLYFDMVEFHDDVSSENESSYQWQKRSAGSMAWGTFRWSQMVPSIPLPTTITKKEKEAFEMIEKRLDHWIQGTDQYKKTQPYEIRKSALDSFIQSGIERYDLYNIKRHEDGRITGEPLYSWHSPRRAPKFAGPSQNVFLPLALDYKLNKNKQSLEKFLLLTDYFYDQGWAEGSSLGTLNHELNRAAGYVFAIYLMRDELQKTSRLYRELNSIIWFTTFKQSFETEKYEITADAMRTRFIYRVLTVLAMDDSPKKVQYMRSVLNYLNSGLSIATGWADTIKPDYMGYHHRLPYHNAYAPNGYHLAAVVCYLLHNTPFALSGTSQENLKNALLTQRIIANKYHTHVGLGGRIATHTLLSGIISAYAYMAFSQEPLDKEMAGAFHRLWDPDHPLFIDLFDKAASKISYFNTMGAIDIMLNLANRKIQPEEPPSGFWSKPYGGIAVHRRNNWMACVKGCSRYIADFEAGKGENLFGRYNSYGVLQILTPKNHSGSDEDLENGWDWNRWPGATTVHLPLDELNTDKKPKKTRHRHFFPSPYLGAVSLEEQNGLWAMDFIEEFYQKKFTFKKSVFFFENQIICLGSDINNKNEDFSTETTLFQCYMKDKNYPISLNDPGPINEFPYTYRVKNNKKVWLTDIYGNGYIIPDARGLHVQRLIQDSIERTGEVKTKGNYTTAYIDHGKSPENGGYEYVILVETGASKTGDYAKNPEYKVMQKNKDAHIVYHDKLRTTGYAIFNSKKDVTFGALKKVGAPVMVMIKHKSVSHMIVSLCFPDFGRPYVAQTTDVTEEIIFHPGKKRQVAASITGNWKLKPGNKDVSVIMYTGADTILDFKCYDAKTIEVELIRK